MQAGQLRKRVTLESRSATQDTFGEPANTWSTVATVWASVEPLSGRELETAKMIAAETSHKVTIRYRSGVTPKMRVNLGGRYLAILAVIDDGERHQMLTLHCVEGMSNG